MGGTTPTQDVTPSGIPTYSRERRRQRAWLLVPGLLTLVGALLLSVLPASAAVDRSDFPTVRVAKQAVNGTGGWSRHVARLNTGAPIGARPSGCRTDRPFRAAREYRIAFYYGGGPANVAADGATVVSTVYRFATQAKAKRAVRKAARFVGDCPRSTEWVCTRCDGIADFVRWPASMPRVGAQSTSWVQRVTSMGNSRERVIVARKGRTVVATSVGNANWPGSYRSGYPIAPTKQQALRAARAALAAAT